MASEEWVLVEQNHEAAEQLDSSSFGFSSNVESDDFEEEDDNDEEGMFDMFTGDVMKPSNCSTSNHDVDNDRSASIATKTVPSTPVVSDTTVSTSQSIPLRPKRRPRPEIVQQQSDLRALNAQAHLPFKHGALLDRTYIRVFQILPAEYPGEPLSLTMSTMLPTRCTYLAVSYAWGATHFDDSHLTHTVACDGRLIRITSNLYTALEVMRHHLDLDRWTMFGERPYVWADAICIDQTSLTERNHQVGLMAEIYGKAALMTMWLGEATLNEDEALMQSINVMRARTTQPGSALANEPLQFTRHDMVKLLQRQWFQRRWVIQEFAVRKSRTVLFGKAAIDFPHFLSLLNEYDLIRDAGPIRDVDQFDSFRPKRWLLTNLHRFREAECSESHDLVYALVAISCGCQWACAYSHCGIKNCGDDTYSIDYGIPVEELFISLANKFLTRDFMAVLVSASIRRNSNEPLNTHRALPSWVPDWRQLPQCHPTQTLEYIDRCFESPISKVRGEGFESPIDKRGWTSLGIGYILRDPKDLHCPLRVSGWIMQPAPESCDVGELPWLCVGQNIPGMISVDKQHLIERDGPWVHRPKHGSGVEYYADIDRNEPHYELISGTWPTLRADDFVWFLWGFRLAFVIRRADTKTFHLVSTILRPAPMRKTAFAWVHEDTNEVWAYGCVRMPPVKFTLV